MNGECIPAAADHYPVEPLPQGWITALVTYRHHDGSQESRTEIIDLKTNQRYLHEPLRRIASKCFFLTLGIPSYTVAYMAWNLIRIPTTTLFTLLEGSQKLFHARTLGEVVQILVDTAWTGAGTVIKGIWTVVRTPFYAIQMFFGALVGILFPLQGRKMLGIETQLHQNLRHPPTGDLDAICDSLKRQDTPHTFFLAPCMQPLGSTTDPHVDSVQPL